MTGLYTDLVQAAANVIGCEEPGYGSAQMCINEEIIVFVAFRDKRPEVRFLNS